MTPYQKKQMRTRLLSYLTVDSVLKDEEEDEIIAYEGGYEDHVEDAQGLVDAMERVSKDLTLLGCPDRLERFTKSGIKDVIENLNKRNKQALDKYLEGG